MGRSNPPRVIAGRYELQGEIAEGGMGVVHRAKQLGLERVVAIKLVSPKVAERDPSFAERFHLEAASLAKLVHPNVVTVHDYGRTPDGELFIAMEHIEGAPLNAVVDRDGPLSFLRILRIALQIARALRAAHAMGIIHRDLKPANVMLMRDADEDDRDCVKVLDFGLAKLLDRPGERRNLEVTRTPTLLGSPKYIAPEQACGDPAAPSADIYSLGAVLFYLTTGTTPFQGSTASEVVKHHIRTPVPELHTVGYRRSVPRELSKLICRCLEKHPGDRYASMHEVIGAIKAAYGALASTSRAMNLSVPPPAKPDALAQVVVEEPELSESGFVVVDPAILEDRAFLTRREPPRPETAFASLEVPVLRKPASGPRRMALLAGVAVGTLLGAVSLGVLLLELGRERASRDIVTETDATRAEEVRVSFDSTPRGARVLDGTVLLGVTPFLAILPKSPGAELKRFVLEREGHLPTVVMIALDRSRITVSAELEVLPPPPAAPGVVGAASRAPR